MVDVGELVRFTPGERTQRLRRIGPDKGGHWEVIEKA